MNKKGQTHCKNGHEFTEENTWRNKYGHRRCRICHNNKVKQDYHTKPDVMTKTKQRAHDHYHKDPQRALQLVKNKRAEVNFKNNLRKYGLTLEVYNTLIESCGSKCRICGFEGKLYIDHCHTTGKVRGLLCPSCNTGLGGFKDNQSLMENAINYLELHSDYDENEEARYIGN